MDISNPGTLKSDNTGDVLTTGNFAQASAADLVLWEFGPSNDADMGYAYNLPPAHQTTNQAKQIVKMSNGKWAAVVGNGYNSSSGKAALYILFIDEGRDGWETGDYVKIVADASGNNGLSTPVPFDSDGDGLADTVYAGDLKGNMWKFEVGPNTMDESVTATDDPETWKVSLSGDPGCTDDCVPLFHATDGASPTPVNQPIVWPPEVTRHPNGGRMILFGTGKYLEPSDNNSTATQSFYGIWDKSATVLRSTLVAQTVASVVTTTAGNFRTTSSNSVDYAGTDRGWYMNLPTSGERITGIPKLDANNNKIIVFNTLIPSTSPCAAGGTGWITTLDYLTGKKPTKKLFDTNNNGVISSEDQLVSAFEVGAALGGTTLISTTTVDGPSIGVSSLTSGALSTTLINLGVGTGGRVSWREIIQ